MMNLFQVTYTVNKDNVRAVLRLNSIHEVIETLMLYHKSNEIDIKNIKPIDDDSRFIYVQYFD
jgi:hypothetical protein